jgi:Uma2 family endonuclease
LGKFCFIEGELIVDMSPESIEEHSEVKTEICRVLANHVRAQKLGRLYIDGVLITHKAARVSNEPDALFISYATLQSGRLTFTPETGRPQSSKEIVGAVDWVLEIISPSTRRKDAKLLRNAYFNAGIPEYWLIDALVEEDAPVDFQILVAAEGGYVPVEPNVDGCQASPTFDRSFRLTRQRDDNGLWQYTLEMKDSPSA